ncbi:MAG: alpha/beta hydrolase [Bacteroidetes bacterium]|nr:alpha/beta hydrolase [Bacteroidota bacterium]
MNLNKLFFATGAVVMLLAGFIAIAPSALTCDLIYPNRIDSIWVCYHARFDPAIDSTILNPGDLRLKYSDFNVRTADSLLLKGWYIPAADTPANTILILHDLNQSKIQLLDYAQQFHDRNYNVCLMDLRAHGTSEGMEFSPGIPSVSDGKRMIDSLLKFKETQHIVVMGLGIGAAIALQVAVYDGRCDAIILQSPFDKSRLFLDRYAYKKWGPAKYFWSTILRKKEEKLLQYPVNDLNLTEIAKYLNLPTLFIAGANDEWVVTSETLEVFQASATEKRSYFWSRCGHLTIAADGGEDYYNRISNFLLAALPRKQKTTRYKKFALNDLPGYYHQDFRRRSY